MPQPSSEMLRVVVQRNAHDFTERPFHSLLHHEVLDQRKFVLCNGTVDQRSSRRAGTRILEGGLATLVSPPGSCVLQEKVNHFHAVILHGITEGVVALARDELGVRFKLFQKSFDCVEVPSPGCLHERCAVLNP